MYSPIGEGHSHVNKRKRSNRLRKHSRNELKVPIFRRSVHEYRK